MKVFGLQAAVYRGARLAAKPQSSEAASRLAALRRWRQARADGLTAGEAARAVGASRASLYRWHKRLEPSSRRPHKLRAPAWDTGLLIALEALRNDYPMWGKKKLVVLLAREGRSVSQSTLARMLKALIARGSVLPCAAFRAKAPRAARRKRPYAMRLPRNLTAREPGDIIQIDTLTVTLGPGHVVKQFTAYDPVAKWTKARAYRSASAINGASFLDELLAGLPFKVRAIQVDGGSEFKASFEQACKDKRLTLYELPPKTPELNGHVERNNATWRYEFYAVYDLPRQLDRLNPLIDAFADLHNTFRPHNALGGKTPAEYLQARQAASAPASHIY